VKYGEVMITALLAIRDCPLPTIAAIDGNCIGGGLEIAAMCDLRLAAADARFGVPIQKIGVTMPYPELKELTALLGRATMLELLLEGGIHGADWAYAKGLVTRICDAAQMEGELSELLKRICAGSPLSHRNHKVMTRRCQEAGSLTPAEIRAGYAACEAELSELLKRICAGSPLSHRNHKVMTRRCQEAGSLTPAEIRAGYAACEA